MAPPLLLVFLSYWDQGQDDKRLDFNYYLTLIRCGLLRSIIVAKVNTGYIS